MHPNARGMGKTSTSFPNPVGAMAGPRTIHKQWPVQPSNARSSNADVALEFNGLESASGVREP